MIVQYLDSILKLIQLEDFIKNKILNLYHQLLFFPATDIQMKMEAV